MIKPIYTALELVRKMESWRLSKLAKPKYIAHLDKMIFVTNELIREIDYLKEVNTKLADAYCRIKLDCADLKCINNNIHKEQIKIVQILLTVLEKNNDSN